MWGIKKMLLIRAPAEQNMHIMTRTTRNDCELLEERRDFICTWFAIMTS